MIRVWPAAGENGGTCFEQVRWSITEGHGPIPDVIDEIPTGCPSQTAVRLQSGSPGELANAIWGGLLHEVELKLSLDHDPYVVQFNFIICATVLDLYGRLSLMTDVFPIKKSRPSSYRASSPRQYE